MKSPIVKILGSILLFALCLGTFTAAQAQDNRDRRVIINNATPFTMQELHYSNVGTNNWGPDRLGSGVIQAGYYIVANIDDGSGYCMYDLKAVFSNGSVVIRRNVNVCDATRWNIYA